MASPAKPIVLYDIAMREPREKTCCSPNPWKARLALNFKGLPNVTKWVPLPEIATVRKGLHLPPVRKFADGTDFYTLPIIEDPNNNSEMVGDSFDIAVYLQKTYPDAGRGDLFPEQTLDFTHDLANILVPLSEWEGKEHPEYARFNASVDAAFSVHVGLGVGNFPFDEASAEATKAEFVRRAGFKSWEDFLLVGEAREKVKSSFRDTLEGLARLFQRDESGPFLLGEKASYADLIVGAWLRMIVVTFPREDWEDVRGWYGGVFGRLHDALDVLAEVK
ncbi:hypothetical protein QBC47DRAFT_330117 [Echria macrotheca]|uniref:GST N-terminal domain-containing protein n=1 Tax=Echria macrotheca TaxID=438768 RepID=A0AAJ0B495_9PEZI|nr:hypothetical protein QBC47DRAFT_330117 [Echria macrotheca]